MFIKILFVFLQLAALSASRRAYNYGGRMASRFSATTNIPDLFLEDGFSVTTNSTDDRRESEYTTPEPPIEFCGDDNSETEEVREGESTIEIYPWFGYVVFPLRGIITTTPVVLIAEQIVVGSAIEVANLPKDDFRARAKVFLGNCTVQKYNVLEYTFHPDFRKETYSSFVLIQLDVKVFKKELRPICGPPLLITKPDFYAVSLSQDCRLSNLQIHRMTYVDTKECRSFYRRTGLNIESIWPKYSVCAKAVKGGSCMWQSGVFLVMKQDNKWMLVSKYMEIGFGVYGPGCSSPARFVDYGMYHQWVRRSLEKIGKPAITRIASNYLIMRRRLTKVQRYGPCDPEETQYEIYSDHTGFLPTDNQVRKAYYNFTIMANHEYSCILFRANQQTGYQPVIKLRRLCLSSHAACYQFSTLQIQFELQISFSSKLEFHINVYGEDIKLIDTKRMSVLVNSQYDYPDLYNTFWLHPTHSG